MTMDRMTDDAHHQRDAGAVEQCDRMSRPWSSVPSRYLAASPDQAGGSRASLSSRRGEVKRVVRRNPGPQRPSRTRK